MSLIIISLFLPLTTQAQIDRDCLKENTINKDYRGRVTLITLDTTTIAGRLLKIDFDNDFLTIQIGKQLKGAASHYTFDSLAAVRFYKGGHIDGEWILVGFLGGGVLGGGISAFNEDSEFFDRDFAFYTGFFAGGLAGLFLSFILPPMLNSETIECGSTLTSEE
ncbi:MAG: hypothetical protein JXA92_13495 [candidate division Zixibacteria bacterium]|nr:hypothetical protein [candidate division Zixibacteria bacterium]